VPGRFASLASSGRWQKPFRPFNPSTCIFYRNNEAAPRAKSQVAARKVANQFNYANKNFVNKEGANGSTAPSFYGYTGIGYGFNLPGFQTVVNLGEFTPAIFVVPYNQPTEKVTLSKSNGEPQEPGFDNNLQASLNAVPMPILELVPAGILTSGGTDRECVIAQKNAAGEIEKMWELYNLRGKPGAWLCAYAAYIGPGSTHGFNGAVWEWNGVFHEGEGGQVYGMRASGLSGIGGIITHQDVIEVLRGGEIKHALEVSMCQTAAEHVPPATRNDSFDNVPEKHEGAANPAYPSKDAVGEGAWLKMPNELHPEEVGISKSSEPIAYAMCRAASKYGIYINDSAGTCSFAWQSYVDLGSPYSYQKVNEFQGASALTVGYKKANEICPSSWDDETLPVLKEKTGSTESMVAKLPWQELELLESFSS
jgi:hypothetical protein